MESCGVVFGCLVVAGGQTPPFFDLVDAALHGVAVFVERGVVADRAASCAAALLTVGLLVGLLRDHRLDLPCAQVGAVGAGGVRLVSGDRVRPGPGAADRPPHLDLLQDREETRTVRGLPGGEDDGQWAAAPVGREVHLAGQPAPGAAPFGGLQPGLAASVYRAAPGPFGFLRVLGRLGHRVVLFGFRSPFSSVRAFSTSSRRSGSTTMPAAW